MHHSGTQCRQPRPAPRKLEFVALQTPLTSRRQAYRLQVVGACQGEQAADVSIADLQEQMEECIAREDYSTAAQLRDKINMLRQDGDAAVLEANELFYKAFNGADFDAMERVWGEGDVVSCMHPGEGNIVGREAVLESWRIVLKASFRETMKVSCVNARAVVDKALGVVTCKEITSSDDAKGVLEATNVFQKQNGRWKIIHHQAGPSR